MTKWTRKPGELRFSREECPDAPKEEYDRACRGLASSRGLGKGGKKKEAEEWARTLSRENYSLR